MGKSSRQWWRYALFLVFPLSQGILFYMCFFRQQTAMTPGRAISGAVLAMLCLLADGALWVAVRSLAGSAELKARLEAEERHLALQEEYYEQLIRRYEQVRRLRHDQANHVYTLKILLEEGRYEDAAAYARELNGEVNTP